MAFDPSTAHFWLKDEDLGQFDLAQQPVGEARYFKKITGMTPLQMMQGFEIGDPDSFAAIVWLLKRHKNQIVDYATIDFAMGDIAIKDADGNTPADAGDGSGPTPAAAASTNAASPGTTSNGDDSSTSSRSLTSAA